MKAHQLDAQGVIINTIVVDSLDFMPNLVDAAIGGSAGDSIINGALVPRAEPLPTIPQSVPRLNARLTLLGHVLPDGTSYWFDITAFVTAIAGSEGDQARAYFEDAQTWRRDNSLVASWATSRNLTDSDLDALFTEAGALNV